MTFALNSSRARVFSSDQGIGHFTLYARSENVTQKSSIGF